MKIAIHQPQYMPWCGYFHKMASVDLFVLLNDVQFKKNEWQHRNRIRNSQGWQWLSVPNFYKFPQLIHEVQVRNDTNWQEKHFKSIQMSYGKAPYYNDYIDNLNAFFNNSFLTIDQVNIASVNMIMRMLKIDVTVEISANYDFEGVSSERLVNICKHFNADTYLAGAGGKDYMDLSIFEKSGITVQFQQFAGPKYKQHWCKKDEDFISGLSALDLIFNCGPQSYNLLMGIF